MLNLGALLCSIDTKTRQMFNLGAMRKNRALTPEEKMDAREAITILDGSGFSLTQAALKVVGRGPVQSVLVDEGISAFLRRCIRRNLSAKTVADYQDKLNAFGDTFKHRTLESLSRTEILAWLSELPDIKESTMNSYRNTISVFLNWCSREDPPLVSANVIAGVNRDAPKTERKIEILTPDEARKVMANAGPYAPMLALMLFAGTRPSEIRSSHKPPMLWKQVDHASRIIRISAQQSKTRTARPLEDLPENIWTWLVKDGDDPHIAPGLPRQAVRRGREAIGRWPQDVCRHSFFTYHLAKFGNISKAMIIAGHEEKPNTMYQHYRGVATKAEAEEFFNIMRDNTPL